MAATASCVTIQDQHTCSAAGRVQDGGICSHLLTSATNDLTFQEFIDFLEPQKDRTCVPVPGMNVCKQDQTLGQPVALPARGAAIAMSAAGWGEFKTDLEVACRELGPRCSYKVRAVIRKLNRAPIP